MPGPIALVEECCQPSCEEPVSIQVPGPAGADGAAGADGEDGISPVTTVAAQFLMPAEGANVTVSVLDSSGIAVGSKMFVQTAGTMQVISKAVGSVLLQNLENTASGLYTDNAAPTTAIPTGSLMMPTGAQGASGALTGAAGGDLEGTFPNPTVEITTTVGDIIVNNNAGVAPRNTRMARGADGTVLHTDAAQPTGRRQSGIDLTGVNTLLTGALPIVGGGTGQTAQDEAFDALAPTTTRGDLITRDATDNIRLAIGAVGTVLKSDGTDPGYGKILPVNIDMGSGPLPRYGLLGSLIGANFNSTADQAITIQTGVSRYIIRRIVVDNASINLTTAAGGIYSNAGKAGVIIVAAAQVYSALTTSGKFKDLTLEAIVGTDVVVATTIYLSLTTAQGAAAVASVWIFGENVTP